MTTEQALMSICSVLFCIGTLLNRLAKGTVSDEITTAFIIPIMVLALCYATKSVVDLAFWAWSLMPWAK